MRWHAANRRRARQERRNRRMMAFLKAELLKAVSEILERVVVKHMVTVVCVAAVGPGRTRELLKGGDVDQMTEEFIAEHKTELAA